MNPKKIKLLAGRVKKSPSFEAQRRTTSRATSNGGVTVDSSVAIESIRETSRKLNYDILNTTVQRNLVQYSEDFTKPVWLNGGATVYSNIIANPLDGAITADLWDDTNASNNPGVPIQSDIISTSTTVTVSIYTKTLSNTGRSFALRNNTTSTFFNTGTLNYSTGLISGIGWSVISLPNGWFRIYYTQTIGINIGDNLRFYVGRVATAAIAGATDTWYTYGAQLEAGTVATTYQKTPAQIGASFIYTPSSYGETRNYTQIPYLRNLVKYSEEFDNAAWGKTLCTVTGNQIANSITGEITADLFTSTSASNTFYQASQSNIFLKSGTYNYSLYYKNGNLISGNSICLYILENSVTSDMQLMFDAISLNLTFQRATGNFTLNSYNVTSLADGGYRLSMSFKVLSDITVVARYLVTNLTSTQGIQSSYGYGAQLEPGSVATPYQRTTDAIIDLQHTRATTSNVTQKDGSIGDGCYNLLQRSEEFDNAAFIKTRSSITPNLIVAPNGTLTADLLIEDTSSLSHTISQNYNSGISSQSYIYSIYAKAKERTFLKLWDGTGSESFGAYFDLVNGTVTNAGSVVASSISNAGNGWYLCSFTIIQSGTTVRFDASIAQSSGVYNYTGDGTSGLYIWGAQLTQGSTLKPYLRTTNRLNVPSIDYSLSTTVPSLLIQPQRTNSYRNSTMVGASSATNTSPTNWGVASGGLTRQIVGTGIENSLNYIDIRFTGIASTVSIRIQPEGTTVAVPALNGQIWSMSMYLKYITGVVDSAVFDISERTNTGIYINNTLSPNLNITTSLSRKEYIRTNTGGATVAYILATLQLNLTIGKDYDFIIRVASPQLELGSNATTWIPTSNAVVTRNGDLSFVDLWNYNMLNKDNFTLYCEGYVYYMTGLTLSPISLSDTTTSPNNGIGIWNGITGFYKSVADGLNTNTGTALSNNSYYKFIIQRNGNTVKFFRNGTQIGTTVTISTFDYRYLYINNGNGSTYTISKIALFKTTLSDSECISLCSPQSNTFEDLAYNYQYTLIN